MDPTETPSQDEQAFARSVFEAEAEAVRRIPVDHSFDEAVQLVLERTAGDGDGLPGGSVVVGGIGKSGLIGRKISATFSSTGTPSHFLHPVEAMHGDLGRVRREDVVLLLSFGGGSEEILSLAALLKQDQVAVIALTRDPNTELGRLGQVALGVGDVTEACPHNLAPTASTAAMLAMGDALALAVSQRRHFGVDDFRRVHPAGSLGRALRPVVEAARFRAGRNLPLVEADATLAEAYREAERVEEAPRRTGALVVVRQGRLAGIFTDADLRRLLVREGPEAWHRPVHEVMTGSPRALEDTALVRDAVQLVREHRIDEVPVVDAEGQPRALIDVQDLVALKVIEE
jgi:arabinose-5-phosphate isomerase